MCSLFYLVKIFFSIEIDGSMLKDFYLKLNWISFFGLFLAHSLVLVLGAFVWGRFVVRLESENFDVRLLFVFVAANIQKYLPGNVMQFIGRFFLGGRLGYKYKSMAVASFLEVFSVFCAVAFLSVIAFFSYRDYFSYPDFTSFSSVKLYFLVAILSIAVLLCVFFRGRFLAFFSDIASVKYDVVLAVALYLLSFLLLGWMVFFVGVIFFDYPENISFLLAITLVFAASWFLGFVLPGVPGGVGVRESAFIFLMSSLPLQALINFDASGLPYTLDQQLLFMVLFVRMIGLLSEFLFALFSWVILSGYNASPVR